MPPAASLHTRIVDACADLAELLGRLEREIVYKRKEGFSAGGSPQKGGHRPLAAWNTPVATLIFVVHAGIRELTDDLTYSVAHTIRPKGGAHKVTLLLLERLPSLAAGADQHLAHRTARQVENWCGQARTVLGEAERWQRLPRQPGEAEPACPWCKNHTLRYKSFTGVVKCITPGCRDSDGNSPQGLLEVGAVSGEPQLAWADRTTGVYVNGNGK
jgi:hypothetical protein